MLCAIILFSLYLNLHQQGTDAMYVNGTVVRMKHNIVHMDAELVMDALAKVYSIRFIRDEYNDETAFHMAETYYKVRVRYKRMAFLYRRTEKFEKVFNSSQHIQNLVEMDYIAMDIDKLVKMTEEWADQEEEQRKLTTSNIDQELPHQKNKNRVWSETHTPCDKHDAHDVSHSDLKEDGFDTDADDN